jgi:hypothetical protein
MVSLSADLPRNRFHQEMLCLGTSMTWKQASGAAGGAARGGSRFSGSSP